MNSEFHAVFAVLAEDNGRRVVRLTPWLSSWYVAQERWELVDDIRRDLNRTGVTNVKYFAVRASDDPDWNGAELAPAAIWATEGVGNQDDRAVLRRIGAEHGLEGREGGWVYNSAGEPQEQGWRTYRPQFTRNGEMVHRNRRYYVNVYRHAIRALRAKDPGKVAV